MHMFTNMTHTYISMYAHAYIYTFIQLANTALERKSRYGVALVGRLPKNIGLFGKRAL